MWWSMVSKTALRSSRRRVEFSHNSVRETNHSLLRQGLSQCYGACYTQTETSHTLW
uniref:Uncharacterized protein n=1 Tax=Anguilla anguilla TaxID=7936 RepID=A0A0E9TMV4_ANGAN